MLDLSSFLTTDNLIFLGVIFGILFVAVLICFIIIRSIFRFITSLFRRKKEAHQMEGALGDKGEDLGVYVEELEKSKAERAKKEAFKQVSATVPMPQGGQPIKQVKQEDTFDKEKQYAQKTEQDIAAGLNRLKGQNSEAQEPSVIGETAKVPSAKDFSSSSETGGVPLSKNQPVINSGPIKNTDKPQENSKNDIEVPSKVTPGETSAVRSDRMAGLKKDDVKINRIKLPPKLEAMAKTRVSTGSVQQQVATGIINNVGKEILLDKEDATSLYKKPEVINDEDSPKSKRSGVSVKGNTAKKNDGSIFGGGEEISRVDLRQKLRKDASVFKAQREAGLTMSPIERAKLEKEVFSQTYGRNISKTDMKWGVKKLANKLLTTKDPAEHAKIRKEIKFFKKIGGIK
jgi:hypothetical protein